MSMLDIVLIGLGLSMDAAAVSVANGLAFPNISWPKKLSIPIAFGLFQGLMPLFGFWAGSLFSQFINRYAPITSFLVLGFIGAKMLWDALRRAPYQDDNVQNFSFGMLTAQAVATSIDAFAVGVSFCASNVNIFWATTIIAITTLLCSTAALVAGRLFGSKIGSRAQLAGGILLIAMAISALL